MMKDVVIQFDATFSLPQCRGQQDLLIDKNAEPSHDDILQARSTYDGSEMNVNSDMDDVQSFPLKSPELVHDLCQVIQHTPVSCRADIYFDTVVKDIFSISRDISFYSSANNIMLLRDIEWDTGFGILISSCALQHGGENPNALYLPNPEPGYFEITADVLHSSSKEEGNFVTVTPSLEITFDLNRAFFHELDRVQRLISNTQDTKAGESDRPSDLFATDRHLIEQNILIYDRTLQILFVFLGLMLVLFLDLYLHFQKQTSRNDAEWNGTPLVVLSNKLYTFGKEYVYFGVAVGYESAAKWKNKLVLWSTTAIETITRWKQSLQNDLKMKICSIAMKISLAFQMACSFFSVFKTPFVIITRTVRGAVQYVRSARSLVVCAQIWISHIARMCTLKLNSNLALLQVRLDLFIQLISNKYRVLNIEVFSRLNRIVSIISTNTLLVFHLTIKTILSLTTWFLSKFGVQVQTEMKYEGSVSPKGSDNCPKHLDDIFSPRVSSVCNYNLYPELVRTGLNESETHSTHQAQEDDHSSFFMDLALQRDRQLQMYENSLVPRRSEADDKGDVVHNSFERSSDDSMETLTLKGTNDQYLEASKNDTESIRSVCNETGEELSESSNQCIRTMISEEAEKDYYEDDQITDETPMICESSTNKIQEFDPRSNISISSQEAQCCMSNGKNHLMLSTADSNALDNSFINKVEAILEEKREVKKNSLDTKMGSIANPKGYDDAGRMQNVTVEQKEIILNDRLLSAAGLRNFSKHEASIAIENDSFRVLAPDLGIIESDHEQKPNYSSNEVVGNVNIAKETEENAINIAVEEKDACEKNAIDGELVAKGHGDKYCGSSDIDGNIGTIDQKINSRVRVEPVGNSRDMNGELLEKLKARFYAISSKDDTTTNDETMSTVTAKDESLGRNSSLSGHSCIRGTKYEISDNVSNMNSSSLHMEIKNYCLQQDIENNTQFSPDRIKNKSKSFSTLMAKWGANEPSKTSSPGETGSSRVFYRPKKLNSPFLKHDTSFSKVKKITPVKEHGAPSNGHTVTKSNQNSEDPLSFLNNMLE